MTSEDLLRKAREVLGESRSEAWLRSLIRDGLLSSAQKRGIAGQRGGRERGTWPEDQYFLFLDVLDALRVQPRRQSLCNIVVNSWLTGERPSVHTPQVRRALRTYRSAVGNRRESRKLAQQLAQLFEAEPETMSRSMRTRFTDAFEKALHDGDVNRDALNSPAFADQVGQTELGRWLGPLGLTTTLEVFVVGRQQVDLAQDQELEAAKELHRKVLALAVAYVPQLAQDDAVGVFLDADSTSFLQREVSLFVILALGVMTKLAPTQEKSPTQPVH